MCAQSVPYVLTSEQWEDRVTYGQIFLQMHENDQEFLNKIIKAMNHGVLLTTQKANARVQLGSARGCPGNSDVKIGKLFLSLRNATFWFLLIIINSYRYRT